MKGTVDGLKFLDSGTSLDTLTGTCFILDSTVFCQSSIRYENARFRVQWTVHSPTGSSRRSLLSWGTAPVAKTEDGIEERTLYPPGACTTER